MSNDSSWAQRIDVAPGWMAKLADYFSARLAEALVAVNRPKPVPEGVKGFILFRISEEQVAVAYEGKLWTGPVDEQNICRAVAWLANYPAEQRGGLSDLPKHYTHRLDAVWQPGSGYYRITGHVVQEGEVKPFSPVTRNEVPEVVRFFLDTGYLPVLFRPSSGEFRL